MTQSLQHDEPASRSPHRRWNYGVHMVEGGLFMGAMAIVNANTVLPAAVSAFGAPSWLISLTPVIMSIGVCLPPLFTAHWIENLPSYKPLLMVTGIVQRLPYLFVGVFLLNVETDAGVVSAFCVALAPLISGLACGVSLSGWQQLVANTVRTERRSSLFAARYLIGTSLGFASSWVVRATLSDESGARGYAMLHLYAFAVLCASYVVFMLVREEREHHSASSSHDFFQNFCSMPSLLRRYRRFALYVLTLQMLSAVFVIAPFLALHLKETLGKPTSFVGTLLAVQMAGGITGNLLTGYLGDRFGGKCVLILAQIALIGSCLLLIGPLTEASALVIFSLFGFSLWSRQVGVSTLSLEVVPREQRSTCLSMIAVAGLVSLLIGSGLSTLARTLGGFQGVLWVTLTLSCGSIGILARLKEPRSERPAS